MSEVKPRAPLGAVLIFLITHHASLFTASAQAAPLDPRSEGALFFPYSVAYPEASNILEINPAGLSVVQGWNTSLFYNLLAEEADRLGLLLHSRPLAVSGHWIESSAYGFPPDNFKGSVGLGFGGKRLFFGAGLHGVGGGSGDPMDRYFLVDAGALFRTQRVSLGFTLYNLVGDDHARGLVDSGRAQSVFRWYQEEHPQEPIYVSPRVGIGVRPFKGLTTFTADAQLVHIGVGGDSLNLGFFDFAWEQVLGRGLHAVAGYRTNNDFNRHEFLLGLTVKARQVRVGAQSVYVRQENDSGAGVDHGVFPALVVVHFHQAAHEDTLFKKNVVAEVAMPAALPDQRKVSFLFVERDNFLDFAARLQRLAENDEVHTVLLRIRSVNMDLGRLQEIRSLIGSLRQKGKIVVAYLEGFDLREYYLAAAADRILIYPHGHLELLGLKVEGTFFKGTLDWLGVVPQFVRAGDYKGAPEQFTEKEFSAKHRENLDSMLGDLFDQVVDGIAEGRKLPRERVTALVDRGFFSTQDALSEGLIDGTATWEEAQKQARQGVGARSRLWDDSRVKMEFESGETWAAPETIAVVYVSGVLARGEERRFPLFSSAATFADSMVSVLRKMEGARSVRAVVLRVNSPGGDVFASDQIWEAVRRLSQKKPVVISMGSVGASGAYYLAMGARPVLADPATITGSIGVFYGKFALKGLYEKLGITKQILKRGRHADVESDYTLLTPDQIKEVQKGVDAWYGVFLDKVREGRGLDAGALEGLAGGRVWTGHQARERGLVDQEGGLLESIELAREKAGIAPDVEIRLAEWPRPKALRGLLKTLVAAPDTLWNLDFELGPLFFLGPVGLE